jgi:2-polyprenyl-6-methoxyphenol hydroxylase-like FAD-dependent oxidoreductase
MTETSILDVLVLGAGPVGLTLANELLHLELWREKGAWKITSFDRI